MELITLPAKSIIYADVEINGEVKHNEPIIFDHIDGIYGYCYLKNDPDMVLHLYAFTKLDFYKDGYKII